MMVATSKGTMFFGALCLVVSVTGLLGILDIARTLNAHPPRPHVVTFNADWASNGITGHFVGDCESLPCLDEILKRLPPTR